MERDAHTSERQLETLRKQLEFESAKRKELEQVALAQKKELAVDRDRLAKYDEELNRTLDDLKAREWELKQLESRQDRTIVEHVHVLEKAKKVTDQQLKEAQEELQKNAIYIRSLEARETKTDQVEHRNRLVQQLQDERQQHKKDLEERDFTNDQTRKKYQG
jgi:myosin protein heavy chain